MHFRKQGDLLRREKRKQRETKKKTEMAAVSAISMAAPFLSTSELKRVRASSRTLASTSAPVPLYLLATRFEGEGDGREGKGAALGDNDTATAYPIAVSTCPSVFANLVLPLERTPLWGETDVEARRLAMDSSFVVQCNTGVCSVNVPMSDVNTSVGVVAEWPDLQDTARGIQLGTGFFLGNRITSTLVRASASSFPGCDAARPEAGAAHNVQSVHSWYWLEQTVAPMPSRPDGKYDCTHVAVSLDPDALVRLARRMAKSDDASGRRDVHNYTIYQSASRTPMLTLWHLLEERPPRTVRPVGSALLSPVEARVYATTSTLLSHYATHRPAQPYGSEMTRMAERSRELGVSPPDLLLPTSRRDAAARFASAQRAMNRSATRRERGERGDADEEYGRESKGPAPLASRERGGGGGGDACSTIGSLIREYETYAGKVLRAESDPMYTAGQGRLAALSDAQRNEERELEAPFYEAMSKTREKFSRLRSEPNEAIRSALAGVGLVGWQPPGLMSLDLGSSESVPRPHLEAEAKLLEAGDALQQEAMAFLGIDDAVRFEQWAITRGLLPEGKEDWRQVNRYTRSSSELISPYLLRRAAFWKRLCTWLAQYSRRFPGAYASDEANGLD